MNSIRFDRFDGVNSSGGGTARQIFIECFNERKLNVLKLIRFEGLGELYGSFGSYRIDCVENHSGKLSRQVEQSVDYYRFVMMKFDGPGGKQSLPSRFLLLSGNLKQNNLTILTSLRLIARRFSTGASSNSVNGI